MTRKLLTALSVAAATMLAATTASATVFYKDYHAAGIWHAYDDVAETYSMKFQDEGTSDGFWLVVSSGANPKTHANEYAILYGDRAENRITAYTYDGVNSKNSFQTGTLLGTFDNAFSDAGEHPTYGYDMTMFSLDVAGINAAFDTPEWDGVQLGDEAGIWFHQAEGTSFEYGIDGAITDFDISGQMWLDRAFDGTRQASCSPTSQNYFCGPASQVAQSVGLVGNSAANGSVPAPGGLALILLGLAGLGLRRRA